MRNRGRTERPVPEIAKMKSWMLGLLFGAAVVGAAALAGAGILARAGVFFGGFRYIGLVLLGAVSGAAALAGARVLAGASVLFRFGGIALRSRRCIVGARVD